MGNDSRTYVLDLLRTMPPDVNYMEDATLSDRMKVIEEELNITMINILGDGLSQKVSSQINNSASRTGGSFYRVIFI